MSFRTRLLLASLPLALIPLAIFGLGARRDVTRRMEAQYAERVAALAELVAEEIERESASIHTRLERLVDAAESDNNLRVALLSAGDASRERSYLLDYAFRAMPLSGLDLLRIQSADGTVLSSGHFRNEFGAVDVALPAALRKAGDDAVLARVETASTSMLVLARAVTLGVGAETFAVVGGTVVDEAFLTRLASGTGLDVTLSTEASAEPVADAGGEPSLVREVTVPLVAEGAGRAPESTARFIVRASDEPVVVLRRDLDERLLATVVLASMLALVLAAVAAAQLSRPVTELAQRAGTVDLDRLDVSFATDRVDEVGDLSRVLQRMTGRLRGSAARLKDAERRATTGDIARQVHHDVRNGLIPIRNVLTHLTQVARDTPERTAEVLLERQGTLESSVSYLQSLAGNYARLAPSMDRKLCDVNGIVRDVVSDLTVAGVEGARIETDLAQGLPPVIGDPVALRRVIENLVVNAVESIEPRTDGVKGRVLVATRSLEPAAGVRIVELGVSDSGRGMSEDERAHMFDDFYTTKARGTGLGLSIVRRLVGDMGGRIEVDSAPGEGTLVTVELPAAGGVSAETSERNDPSHRQGVRSDGGSPSLEHARERTS